MKRRELLTLGAAALLVHVVGGHSASGQSKYPDRPIRLVIPFAPGGLYDSTGRPWAEAVKPHLGTVVVENMGGGGSSLGTAAVARAQPDGYTILLGGTPGLVVNFIASTRLPYHPVKDFESIAILGYNPTLIDVHPALPIRNLKELADYAKANPGKLSFGSSGTGSANHLVGERFKALTGADIPHVPYRGAGPALTDLISGHIPMLVQSVSAQAFEMHNTGKHTHSRRDKRDEACGRAAYSDCRGRRISRPDVAEFHRPLCAEGHAESDRGTARGGLAEGAGRQGPAADVQYVGVLARFRFHAGDSGAVAGQGNRGVDAGHQGDRPEA